MAKSTHSQEITTGTSDSYTEVELTDPVPPVRIQRAMLGGEPKSVGNNSEASSESPAPEDSLTEQDHQEPVLTTESLSDESPEIDQTEFNSTVHTTDGSGQRTTQPRSGKKTTTKKTATTNRSANVRSADGFDDDF